MSQRILVVGGTGMLGEPVCRRLVEDGYQVRVLTRSVEHARTRLGDSIEITEGDVDDRASLERALAGCRGAHINLNGALIERRGVAAVVGAAHKAGLERITYISGASVTKENCWFDATKAKYDAEATLRASGVPYTILKATFFMESLPKYVQGKRASVIGTQPFPWHWVAAGDYARMVSSAYSNPRAANKSLFVLGPEPYLTRDALQKYCDVVHPEAAVSSLPFWAAALIARLTRQEGLVEVLPFFRYTERVTEAGSSAEANELLGAPTTTLDAWARAQLGDA